MNKATPQTISNTHIYFISGYFFFANRTPRIITKQNDKGKKIHVGQNYIEFPLNIRVNTFKI